MSLSRDVGGVPGGRTGRCRSRAGRVLLLFASVTAGLMLWMGSQAEAGERGGSRESWAALYERWDQELRRFEGQLAELRGLYRNTTDPEAAEELRAYERAARDAREDLDRYRRGVEQGTYTVSSALESLPVEMAWHVSKMEAAAERLSSEPPPGLLREILKRAESEGEGGLPEGITGWIVETEPGAQQELAEGVRGQVEPIEPGVEEPSSVPSSFDSVGSSVLVLVVLLGGLLLYAYFAFALMTIARKTKTPGAWFAWVPILNVLLMCRVAGRPGWWVLLALVPLLNLIIAALLWMGIATAREKPSWTGLLVFVPLVGLVIPGYLAFGDAEKPAVAGFEPASVQDPFVCPRCGLPTDPTGAFCGDCGQPLSVEGAVPFAAVAAGPLLCPRCEAPASPEDAFCGECGQPLSVPSY